jgi:hypothetical protein
MVYVPAWLPAQLKPLRLIVGVTVTVAVIGAVPLLTAVKLGIVFVVPVVGLRPILVLFTLQLKVAGLTVELKALLATVPCVQTVRLLRFCICGFGFTVIVKDEAEPLQPLAVGVTVIVLTCATLVVF